MTEYENLTVIDARKEDREPNGDRDEWKKTKNGNEDECGFTCDGNKPEFVRLNRSGILETHFFLCEGCAEELGAI